MAAKLEVLITSLLLHIETPFEAEMGL